MDIFKNISNFNYVIVIALLCFVSVFYFFECIKNYKKLVGQFDNKSLLRIRNKSSKRNIYIIKKTVLLVIVFFIAIVLLRPQWGDKESNRDAMGIDIVFSLDVSDSMKALDFSNGRNKVDRLDMAKTMIKNFLVNRENDRVSLVVFAGEAFVSCPLTMDHNAFITFLDDTSYNEISKGGTNLGEALKASLGRFLSNEEDEKARSKVVILITDGEDQDSNYEDIIDIANDDGVQIFTIGIGGSDGSLIPIGKDVFGRMQYKKYKGELVRTSLDEDTLKTIAKETGGEYFNIENNDDLDDINKQIEKIAKSKVQVSNGVEKEEQYSYFAWIAFILFIIYILLPDNI